MKSLRVIGPNFRKNQTGIVNRNLCCKIISREFRANQLCTVLHYHANWATDVPVTQENIADGFLPTS